MSERIQPGRKQWGNAFAVLGAALIVAFAVWSVSLVLSVHELRAAVEHRVGWLTTLQTASVELDGDRGAVERLSEKLRRTAAEMEETPARRPSLSKPLDEVAKATQRLERDPDDPAARAEARVAVDGLVKATRAQTAEISRELGDLWNSLYALVAAALIFAGSSFGMFLYLQRVRLAQAEQAREVAESRLRHADRLSVAGTLAASVAHEVNNPLQLVMTTLKILEERLSADERENHQELLADAVEGVERVAVIVRDLRALTSRDEGDLARVDPREPLEVALRLVTPTMPGVRFVRDYADVPPVSAVARRLEQVFLNLLLNAGRAIRERAAGGGEIHVRSSATEEGEVVVEVTDDGVGIPDDALARVFEPFFTTKSTGEGTGLGLFVCQGILKAFDGTLQLERREDRRGTRAIVRLPPAERPSHARLPNLVGKGAENEGTVDVVIIDDDAGLRRALTRLLPDYRVVSFGDAASALEHVLHASPSVIVCDISMPMLGGGAFYRRLREERPDLASGVIFMSGSAATPQVNKMLAETGRPLLPKPFDKDAFLGAIARVRATHQERTGS